MVSGDTFRRKYTAGNYKERDPPPSQWKALGQDTQEILAQRAIGFSCLNQNMESALTRHYLPDKAYPIVPGVFAPRWRFHNAGMAKTLIVRTTLIMWLFRPPTANAPKDLAFCFPRCGMRLSGTPTHLRSVVGASCSPMAMLQVREQSLVFYCVFELTMIRLRISR
jgi:hypothetical protein